MDRGTARAISRVGGARAPSGAPKLGGATLGGTVMKPEVVLHLEDAAFALVAAAVLVGVPVVVVLLGLR
jgi:hypothetical protein